MKRTFIYTRVPAYVKEYYRGIRRAEREERRAEKRLRWNERNQKFRQRHDAILAIAYQRAKELREKATSAEIKLKELLTNSGIKFIFQHVAWISKLRYRILDFYIPHKKLGIELDGTVHDIDTIKQYDAMKDSNTRFKVIRLKNNQVFEPLFMSTFRKSARL